MNAAKDLPKISHADWRSVHHVKAELLTCLNVTDVVQLFQSRIEMLIQGTFAGYAIHDKAWRMVGASELNNLPEVWNYIPQIQTYMDDHVIFSHYKQEDPGLPVRRSDLQSIAQFERTALYNEAFKYLPFKYQMSAGKWDQASFMHMSVLFRDDRDFSERDRALLGHLFPSFIRSLFYNRLIDRQSAHIRPAFTLTRREQEVLHWIKETKTNLEIAMLLGLSTRTVDKHVQSLFEKMGTKSRGETIAYTLQLYSRKSDTIST